MARKLCAVDGCGRVVVSHGLCNTHRQRVVRHGSTEQTRPQDWGLREKHPLWHTHQSGKRTKTLCPEWHDDFWAFVNGVGERREGYTLRRKDLEQPFGPDNFQWVEKRTRTQKSMDWAAYQRDYRKRNVAQHKGYDLKRKYGITYEQYESMLIAQNGVCAICEQPETALKRDGTVRDLAVDHCHTTGKVRALLCTNCNQGLGSFRDDPDLLAKALAYVTSA